MNSPIYSKHLTVAEALQFYFAAYHFADGGYNTKWFKIKIGPLFLPFPNSPTRIKAVKFHDIHHLLTEYTALWKGEVEIGAWEIASGCGKHYVAWLLNFGSFSIGLFLYHKALYKAFMMGCHVKTNLYDNCVYDHALLIKTIGELREELEIGAVKKNTVWDIIYFLLCVAIVISVLAAIVFLFCFIFTNNF